MPTLARSRSFSLSLSLACSSYISLLLSFSLDRPSLFLAISCCFLWLSFSLARSRYISLSLSFSLDSSRSLLLSLALFSLAASLSLALYVRSPPIVRARCDPLVMCLCPQLQSIGTATAAVDPSRKAAVGYPHP